MEVIYLGPITRVLSENYQRFLFVVDFFCDVFLVERLGLAVLLLRFGDSLILSTRIC
jgi:hypothetical protein